MVFGLRRQSLRMILQHSFNVPPNTVVDQWIITLGHFTVALVQRDLSEGSLHRFYCEP
jgi:hypothetical protein